MTLDLALAERAARRVDAELVRVVAGALDPFHPVTRVYLDDLGRLIIRTGVLELTATREELAGYHDPYEAAAYLARRVRAVWEALEPVVEDHIERGQE